MFTTRIGRVDLTIPDLARSVAFYETQIGLRVQGRDGGIVRLGAGGADLLALHESSSAPHASGTTGLYHFAILVPSRADLASALRRLVETNTEMQGAADHGVSEALYLADPDGNGIEIYRDRARDEWPLVGGRLEMGSEPLDVAALLNTLSRRDGSDEEDHMPDGTIVGHVHLHVAHLNQAEKFYADLLGFDVQQRWGHAALFVSYDGYHHHVGLNTWKGVGVPPPPPGAIGLRHFELRVRDLAAVTSRLNGAGVPFTRAGGGVLVADPSSNHILLVS